MMSAGSDSAAKESPGISSLAGDQVSFVMCLEANRLEPQPELERADAGVRPVDVKGSASSGPEDLLGSAALSLFGGVTAPAQTVQGAKKSGARRAQPPGYSPGSACLISRTRHPGPSRALPVVEATKLADLRVDARKACGGSKVRVEEGRPHLRFDSNSIVVSWDYTRLEL
jgi:hypothetical protein